MSNPNGYLTRSMLDELDKKKEKKTTTPIVDNWQRLTVSQLERQKADGEAKRAQSVAVQAKKNDNEPYVR